VLTSDLLLTRNEGPYIYPRYIKVESQRFVRMAAKLKVALAQALLYRCVRMRLSVFRNIPSRYKRLFKFIKFYQLMHTIQGDLDSGYEVLLDGPVSMFRLWQKYGIQSAVFLPALLLCTRWEPALLST